MDVIITKIEPQTPEESNDMIREEIVEITSTPSIVMEGNLLERMEQPFLSQSERNLRQMIEDENLIFAVQKFPIIYDRTNPNYQNKEQVRYVWSVIAENSNRSPDYCHKRWRYLRDYFVRQLRYHRSSTDPNKLKRPWVLFNKLTFLIPFVAHVVDKNNFESYSEMTNGYTFENKAPVQEYLSKYQNENYYECDGTENKVNNGPFVVPEIHDLTMDLNEDTTGEDEETSSHHPLHGFVNNKKRKLNSNITFEPVGHERKHIEKLRGPETSLDEHDHFLHSLAPELRKIDSKYTLHFRNEVHNLIIKYQTMTGKLKAIQLNANLETLVHSEVKFDTDLPEFRTNGGVNNVPNTSEFYVKPVMWVKALDIVLDRLVVQGADLSTVTCISGSAQQHGSVYWSSYGVKTLSELDSDKFLHCQIDDSAFTVTRTPIWMDGSTEKQCIEMEEAIGGREKMVEYTGSKCYARFTGPQIRKVYQNRSDCYENTQRISLVSSFLASLFLGKVAPIDFSDGSGMNLLDISTKSWSQPCLNACAPDLEDRLGEPVATDSIIGEIGTFFVQRYSFSSNCKIVCFTGDNPSALAGLLVSKNMLAMSLGTSDTIMMTLATPTKMEEGHVLIHPTEDGYMGLLCFKNGSLIRDEFKRVEGNNSWEYFSELLDSTPRGNFGNMALHFTQEEIIPKVKGTLRWNKLSNSSDAELAKGVSKFSSPQTEIRALIEGQMLHHKAVASDMGYSFEDDTKILTTGGASENKSILQVVSDVFNAPVYIQKSSEAALLGAAFRAKYVYYISENKGNKTETYFEFIKKFLPHHMQRVCDPSTDSSGVYSVMQQRYREMVYLLQSSVAKYVKNK